MFKEGVKTKDLKLKIMLTESNYEILQPVIYTCRLFGLCPLAFQKVGNYYQIKYSNLLVLYSYAVLIIFGIGTIIGIRRDLEAGSNAIRMNNTRTKYITLCDMAMVFAIALYGVVSIPYRMKRFVRMLDLWSSVDKLIPISNTNRYRKCSIIFIVTTILAAISLFSFDVYNYVRKQSVSNDFYLQNYISYYMLYLLLIAQEIFFWHLVFFIHIRLISLNESLANVKNNLKTNSKTIFLVQHSQTNKIQDNSALRVKFYENNPPSGDRMKFEKNTADRIQELIKIYGRIKESVEILNDSASYGIVLIILSCLLHLVVTPYFLLVEIFREHPNIAFIALQTHWFLGHIGRLLIMVEPCQRCLKKYKITTNLVSEMALMEFDENTKKSLKTFASLFCHSAVTFNACGYFNIDRNLLTSVAGAVTTYLVILFQFNGSYDNS